MLDVTIFPVFISVKQAAVLLGFSRATAYRMAESEELPIRRIGGRIYVISADLPTFVKQIGLTNHQGNSEEDHAA